MQYGPPRPPPKGEGGEWTAVKRGKAGKPSTASVKAAHDSFVPDKSITLQQLKADFNKKMRVWQQSSCRKRLLLMLTKARQDGELEIGKALCLGSNSFAMSNFTNNQRSMMQVVCFIDVARELAMAKDASKIELFAQDPAYQQVDKDLLADKDVTILETGLSQYDASSPEQLAVAKQHIGPTTIVFEFYTDIEAKYYVDAFQVENALFIGTPWERQYDSYIKRPIARQDTDLVKKLKQFKASFSLGHETRLFPDFDEDPTVFMFLWVRWKTPCDSESED